MRWTLPNILTLARICLTPVIALLPFIEGYWPKVIAFLIFLAAKRPGRRGPAPPPRAPRRGRGLRQGEALSRVPRAAGSAAEKVNPPPPPPNPGRRAPPQPRPRR